ncbi:MAG: bacterial Ig-like domain-containing protein [Oscillospiraceae bacterium]|nr:bacterial Ig-like domain-containing protein [Oscillospiraceae bacterium]
MRRVKIYTIVIFLLVLVLYAGSQVNNRIIADTKAPVFSCESDTLMVSVASDESDLLEGITARDNRDGDITSEIRVGSTSKLINDNTAKVSYYVFDRADNMATYERYIQYTDYHKPEISIARSLIYAAGEKISITDRITAEDVIEGDISAKLHVSATDVSENVEGLYHISVFVTNSMGDTAEMKLPIVVTSNGLNDGEIKLTKYLEVLKVGDSFNPEDYPVGGITSSGREVSLSDYTITSTVDIDEPGTYVVQYTAKYYGNRELSGSLIVVVEE